MERIELSRVHTAVRTLARDQAHYSFRQLDKWSSRQLVKRPGTADPTSFRIACYLPSFMSRKTSASTQRRGREGGGERPSDNSSESKRLATVPSTAQATHPSLVLVHKAQESPNAATFLGVYKDEQH